MAVLTPIDRTDSRIMYSVYPDRNFTTASSNAFVYALNYPSPPLTSVSEPGMPANTDGNSSISKVDDPVNSGRKAIRHFVRGDYPLWGSNYLSVGSVPSTRRAEVISGGVNTALSICMYEEYVLGFGILPMADLLFCKRPIVVLEIDEPDPVPGGRVHNGPGQLCIQSSGYASWDIYYGGDPFQNGNFSNNGWFPVLRSQVVNSYGVGVWQYFVIYIRNYPDSTGFLRVYTADEVSFLSGDLISYTGSIGGAYDTSVVTNTIRPLRFGIADKFPVATNSNDTLTCFTKGIVCLRVSGSSDIPSVMDGVLGLMRTL